MVEFKSQMNYVMRDLCVIFAPNSTGKTLYSESFVNQSEDFFVLNKRTIHSIISRKKPIPILKEVTGDGFNFGHTSVLRINSKNLNLVNEFIAIHNVTAFNGSNDFNGLELKKGRKKTKLNGTSEEKIRNDLGISSSEYEFIIFCLFYFSEFGNSIYVFDDPIEMASFENE